MKQAEFCKTHRIIINLMTRITPINLREYLQALDGDITVNGIDVTEKRYQGMPRVARALVQFQQVADEHVESILAKGHC